MTNIVRPGGAGRRRWPVAQPDYLIEVVSNRQAEVDIRTVDAMVAWLRRKLLGSGTPVIASVTGVGYKLKLSERL